MPTAEPGIAETERLPAYREQPHVRRIPSSLNRTEQVYAMIRDSICDCTLAPGKHLVQEELAATLGISRQPVQQAMLLLKNDGLVVESGARGLYVSPLDPESMAHRYQIRLVLDQLAARLVAERSAESPEFAEQLRQDGERILLAGEKAQKRGSSAAMVSHDVTFHSFLYERSGNPQIASTAEAHWAFLRRVMIAVLKQAARGEIVWDEHRQILDAVASGDAERGVELASAHVLGAQDALLTALRESESYGGSGGSDTRDGIGNGAGKGAQHELGRGRGTSPFAA